MNFIDRDITFILRPEWRPPMLQDVSLLQSQLNRPNVIATKCDIGGMPVLIVQRVYKSPQMRL